VRGEHERGQPKKRPRRQHHDVGDPGAPLAEASRRFWSARLDLAGQMVERAVARGEIPPQPDPRTVIEAVVAPIYFRLLMSGEPLDDAFVSRLADLVAAGAARGQL
jgi:hypothetical protein